MIWWKKTPAKAPDPGEIDALWREAFGHHQAGRIDQAVKLYRSLLKDAPDHFDARHLLGVAALQQGRLDEAHREITAALALNPKDSAAHNNLGTTLMRQGRLPEARESFEAALKLRPGDPDANVNLATVLMRQGDPAAAVAPLRKAMAQRSTPELRKQLGTTLIAAGDAAAAVRELRLVTREQPGDAHALNQLGIALAHSGDTAAALKAYDQALALMPDETIACNRALLLADMGRMAQARAALEELARKNPKSAAVHANLGALLRDQGDLPAARASLERALKLDAALAPARITLAMTLLDGADLDGAQRQLDELLDRDPAHAEGWMLRGRIGLARREFAAAESALARAIELAPRMAEPHHLLGLVRMGGGDAAGARRSHERALELDPSHQQARWAAVMARLPAMPPREEEAALSRQDFAAGVQELERWYTKERAGTGHAAVGSTQPFYLAYQRGNHRELMQGYARLCARLMRQWSGAPTAPAHNEPKPQGKLRLGIVSAHFADHSVWTAIVRGWVQQLDRARFELHLFDLGTANDEQTRTAHQLAARVHKAPAGLGEWVRRIGETPLDAVLYPEVGMDAMTLRLAALRLAPLQLASWGHPVTTGLPTIDAFISADAMEPADAQDHYAEKLVRLPALGVCYEPLQVARETLDVRALGLAPERPWLLSPGLPFKYAPEDDAMWARIARRVPQAQLVFFASGPPLSHAALETRLERAFADEGLAFASHAVFVPHLSRAQFFALMRRATLFLDTVGFSGFNTAMQAIECDLPIVTMEGASLRGRFGAGILRELGMADCIAADAAGYVEIVSRLVQDAAAHAEAKARLVQQRPRLFGAEAPVRALEAFLLQACGSVK
jgi:predicted O-linked N-acetylglucosamine transferase (SPINDLY family)